MATKTLEVFHTWYFTTLPHKFPQLAEGFEQWLGDGYYFWQDYYFAKWWGNKKKCHSGNLNRLYTIYNATLEFDEDDFIDTVFNEEDYYRFCKQIEKFAKECQKNLGRKPNLEEFNSFVDDFKIWQPIKVIRFQDLPESQEHIEVTNFFYKKRIQIRVNDPSVIKKFNVNQTFACI